MSHTLTVTLSHTYVRAHTRARARACTHTHTQSHAVTRRGVGDNLLTGSVPAVLWRIQDSSFFPQYCAESAPYHIGYNESARTFGTCTDVCPAANASACFGEQHAAMLPAATCKADALNAADAVQATLA